MRVEYENGGFSELERYFLGCFLKSVDCIRHFLIGDREIPKPLQLALILLLLCGEDGVLEEPGDSTFRLVTL